MPNPYQGLANVIQKGVLLFASFLPIPAPNLIAALAGAVITKALELKDQPVRELLSQEISLQHIPYVEPDSGALLRFYSENPLYPSLATKFHDELANNDLQRLRELYRYLYGVLILERTLPSCFFRRSFRAKNIGK